MNATKFSIRSNSLSGAQVPRIAVSNATSPRVPSASMTFQSPKNSYGAYVEPTFASEPFDNSTNPFGTKSCGIAAR